MNKKKFMALMLFVAVMLLTANCSPSFKSLSNDDLIPGKSSFEKTKKAEEGLESIIEATDYYTLSVHYPITESQVINAEIQKFTLNRMELYKQEVAELYQSNDGNTPFELHLSYETPYWSAGHVTILFTESKYLGGTQNQIETFVHNYDLSLKKKLTLENLFDSKQDYLTILSNLSYDLLTANSAALSEEDLPTLRKGLSPSERNFSNFAVLFDEVRFYFDKNQLGPSFSEQTHVSIPIETLRSHLNFKPILTSPLLPDIQTLGATDSGPLIIEDDKDMNASEKPPTEPVANNSRKSKKIALTFETGPHPTYTPIILDALKSRNSVATFFYTGQRAFAYSPVVVRTQLENHSIGNGSYNHPQMVRLSPTDMSDQIDQTQSILSVILQEEPFLFRPPYGAFNDVLIKQAEMPIILWSIDPQDWIYQDPDYIVSYVLDHAFDGAIIRLRDTLPATTQAITPLIDGLNKAGYELVTVSELLGINRDNQSRYVRAFSKTIQ